MTDLMNVPGGGFLREQAGSSPVLLPRPGTLPSCESCGFRPAPLLARFADGESFHVCPTCHVDWRDR